MDCCADTVGEQQPEQWLHCVKKKKKCKALVKHNTEYKTPETGSTNVIRHYKDSITWALRSVHREWSIFFCVPSRQVLRVGGPFKSIRTQRLHGPS